MAITANAWVSESGTATITFYSTTGWTSAVWSLNGTIGDFPDSSYIDLYSPWNQSGVGVISGDYLTITISPCPPGYFKVQTQRGGKLFLLDEAAMVLGSALVGVNSVTFTPVDMVADNNYAAYYDRKALLYFGGQTNGPFQGRVQGQLQVDGKLHATVAGTAVDSVRSSDGSSYWAVPAMAFYDFYWHIVPDKPTDYDFIFGNQRRGVNEGARMKFKVNMDLNGIYSPGPSGSFNVSTTDQFTIAMKPAADVRELS